jgi:hypothetical protein
MGICDLTILESLQLRLRLPENPGSDHKKYRIIDHIYPDLEFSGVLAENGWI